MKTDPNPTKWTVSLHGK